MATAVRDLSKYAGRWIALRPDGNVVTDAETYPELLKALEAKDVDSRAVAILEVPKEDGALLL